MGNAKNSIKYGKCLENCINYKFFKKYSEHIYIYIYNVVPKASTDNTSWES
jgi:hypothetical protein